MDFTAKKANDYEVPREKLKSYCKPWKNLTYLRPLFFTQTQAPNELIDAYVTDLKSKAKECEFAQLTESLIWSVWLQPLAEEVFSIWSNMQSCHRKRHFAKMSKTKKDKTRFTVKKKFMSLNKRITQNCLWVLLKRGRLKTDKSCKFTK